MYSNILQILSSASDN